MLSFFTFETPKYFLTLSSYGDLVSYERVIVNLFLQAEERACERESQAEKLLFGICSMIYPYYQLCLVELDKIEYCNSYRIGRSSLQPCQISDFHSAYD